MFFLKVGKYNPPVVTPAPAKVTKKAEIPLHSLVIKPEKAGVTNSTPLNLSTNGKPGKMYNYYRLCEIVNFNNKKHVKRAGNRLFFENKLITWLTPHRQLQEKNIYTLLRTSWNWATLPVNSEIPFHWIILRWIRGIPYMGKLSIIMRCPLGVFL